jgi:hypothetical protein
MNENLGLPERIIFASIGGIASVFLYKTFFEEKTEPDKVAKRPEHQGMIANAQGLQKNI